MADQDDFGMLLDFFKVLGNESRLKIVGLLANEPHSVGELAARLELKEPTVSHHLARLKEMKLVNVRAEGTTRIYSLASRRLEAMNRDLFTQEKMASIVDDYRGEAWEEKVMHAFVDQDGRIIAFPAQLKKRLVLWRWLAEKFEPDRRYPEADVNEILKAYHEDTATIRRALVSHNLMARANGIYWRLPAEEEV